MALKQISFGGMPICRPITSFYEWLGFIHTHGIPEFLYALIASATVRQQRLLELIGQQGALGRDWLSLT